MNLTKFQNGFLSQPSSSFKIKIQQVSGQTIYFKINNNENLCQAGTAKLLQDFNYLDLWKKVVEFDPNNLPLEMNFNDFVPAPTQKSDVLSYQLRLSCLGEVGLASNIVHDFRMPAIPETPPPFAVTTIGTDFYNRTMIKIKFINQTDGIYSIWWANGKIDNVTAFKDKATMGEFQDQKVHRREYIYDLLSLPIVYNTENLIPITVGVRQVNEGGSASEFQIVSFNFKNNAERNLV